MPDVTMPQLGETVTEGTVIRWFKQVGERVDQDETLFEVSTEKVDSEVPSPASGYLVEIRVTEGETVAVGATLAVLADEPPGGGDGAGGAGGVEAPPRAGTAPPSGGDGAPGPGRPAAVRDNRLLSPVVRRLISEHDLDPATIEGSGAGGRITRNDVLAVVEGGDRTAPERREAPAPPRATRPPAPAARSGDEVVPFTNIRRRTAEHMMRSLATSAHTLVVVEVDYDNVERVRLEAKERFRAEEGVGLTYLPFISRAVVDAIREFPYVNASVGDDELHVHRDVHLGIAVDLNLEGLMVPVVHQADTKRLRALAGEIADLAARARGRKLGPDDIAGGTITITNPGPFGTLVTSPIINQPQVAILSTDGIKKRPVAVELADGTDAIAVHPVGNLALAFDHRAIDGAYASAFLAKVKEILETRDWSAEIS
ncbi:MAG: dihydrolipoamide acetyltransferase family protein [Acidimicrobiales bacterium]